MKNSPFRFIDGVIYLVLMMLGGYFGRFHGAILLVSLYFFYIHYPKLKSNYSHEKVSKLKKNQKENQLKRACEQLSVSPSCSLEELQVARRRLLNRYHPDKWVDATQKQKKQAEKKVNEINHAFKTIKKIKKL